MKKSHVTCRTLGSLFLLLILTTAAQALSFRTWVAGDGNDANPCTLALPCLTLAAAILQTRASGEINAKNAGDFGPVTIDKSITIDGGGTFSGISTSGAVNAVTIDDSASATPDTAVVTLRNLSINGAGAIIAAGVVFSSGKTLNIENCRIFNFYYAINISLNDSERNVSIRNSSILNSSRGVHAAASGAGFVIVSLNRCNIEQNDFGVDLSSGSYASIRDSVIQFNYYGVQASMNTVNIMGSQINNNSIGLSLDPLATATLGSSTFVYNDTDFDNGGTIQTFGNNETADPIPGVVTNLGLK